MNRVIAGLLGTSHAAAPGASRSTANGSGSSAFIPSGVALIAIVAFVDITAGTFVTGGEDLASARLTTAPEGAIATAPDLVATVRGATRVSAVATYANYQLITTRGCGPG